MRICFIGNAGHVNLLSWARQWHEVLGDTVHVVSFDPMVEDMPGVRLHRLNYGEMKRLRYLLAIPQLVRRLKEIEFDVLVAYRMNSYGFMAAVTGFRPLVLVAQGSDIFHRSDSFFKKRLLRYVMGKADLVHCFAEHMARKLVAFGAERAKMLVLPKGIDTDVFHDRRIPSVPGLNLVTTRQLRKTYRHECILKAIPLVVDAIPHLSYRVLGDGEDREELVKLAGELGVERFVTFAGRVEHERLTDHLCSAHIYVSMQPSDGVSASLLEAMACGVFPIVVDNEANRLWIENGRNGFLVPAEDVSSLAEKIILAFRDSALRERARQSNTAFVRESMSIGANIRKAVECYSRLADLEGEPALGSGRCGVGSGRRDGVFQRTPEHGGCTNERS